MTTSTAPATAGLLPRLLAIFAGGFLGTALRLALLALLGDRPGLAVANLAGCLAIGLIGGWFGDRMPLLRVFLAVGCVASFTSWSTLALQGLEAPWLPMIQSVGGIGLAVAGYELGRRLGRSS